MAWWSWVILGIALLGVELFVIDVQLYLVFLGVSAVLVGLAGLLGLVMPEWAQWLVFCVLAVVTTLAFRRRIYARVSKRSGHVESPLTLGDRVRIPARTAPGETCRVDYRGTSWAARNVHEQPLEAGQEVVIVSVDGLTLNVKPQ